MSRPMPPDLRALSLAERLQLVEDELGQHRRRQRGRTAGERGAT